MAYQLGGNEACGFRPSRQIRQHRLALADTLLGVRLAQDDLWTRLVQIVAEIKAAGLSARKPALAPADRPPRDDLRETGYVGLAVAAVDSQGVQLEDFSRQIFIDAELTIRRVELGTESSRCRARRH